MSAIDKTIFEFTHECIVKAVRDLQKVRDAIEHGRFYAWSMEDEQDRPRLLGRDETGQEVWDVHCPAVSIGMPISVEDDWDLNHTVRFEARYPIEIFSALHRQECIRIWSEIWEALMQTQADALNYPGKVMRFAVAGFNIYPGRNEHGIIERLESSVTVTLNANWRQVRTLFYSPSQVANT